MTARSIPQSKYPLVCSEATALACRASLEGRPLIAGNEIMFMPAGLHVITPSQGGRAVRVQVLVDRAGADSLEIQRAALEAKGERPYFDLNHKDDEASFWPEAIYWRDGAHPGIYARGEWTALGLAAKEGKTYRTFSPVFHVDSTRSTPARIIDGLAHGRAVDPNMGGLVNDPAFKAILPLWAKDAGAPSDSENQNQIDNMTKEERARLQSTIQGLQNEITSLKAKNADAGDLRSKEAELRAAQAELRAADAEAEVEALKGKNNTQASAITARNKVDAEAAVKAAVERGAIAAKDTKTQEALVARATEDPDMLGVIAAMQGNAALSAGRVTKPVGEGSVIERGLIGGREAVEAYAAVVAKNAKIQDRNDPLKAKLAEEAGEIFYAEMKGQEDRWFGVRLEDALKGADATSATVGTLAGTLVLQQSLPLLSYNFPVLRAMFTDFSSQTANWGSTEMTRIIIKPAVTEYDPTPDANGRPKGFVVVTPAQTIDVPITLSKHVGIPMVFGVQTLASTVRNLFGEQSEAAMNALGGYFVNMATALMTSANFNAYAATSVGTGVTTNGSTTVGVASTASMYPGQAISGTGIPANARVASITDSTHAVITLAATADGTGLTFTLNESKVPTTYATFAQALADFGFASLGSIGAAFSDLEVPEGGRFAMLNSSYYQRLTQDPAVNTFFAATRSPDMINKGILPELNGFTPNKAPYFPRTSNRVGFAGHKAAIALKARIPQDFARAVNATIPGSITTVTDPATKLSVLHVERVDLVGRYAESSIEAMLGANMGDRRCGLVITDQ